jgi:hypothetical protein
MHRALAPRLVDAQVGGAQQEAVGGQLVARVDEDEVAHGDGARLDHHLAAAAHDARLDHVGALLAQLAELQLLVVVVGRRHRGDDEDGDEDGNAVDPARGRAVLNHADDERDDGGDEEDDQDDVLEAVEENRPPALVRRLGQLVLAKLRAPRGQVLARARDAQRCRRLELGQHALDAAKRLRRAGARRRRGGQGMGE